MTASRSRPSATAARGRAARSGWRAAAPDPAAQLVQLRQAQALGVLDDHQAGVGHVDAHLDHRGGHQQLQLAALEGIHHRGLFRGFMRPWIRPTRSSGSASRSAR
jgi:hypothetical protein